MRIVLTTLCVLTLAACVPRAQTAVVVEEGASTKRITRESGNLVLPDGTRVTPDATGGFSLPNGDYVRRDPRGALLLPNGARCVPDSGGYACP